MTLPVSLRAVIDAMEMQGHECHAYLNRRTGELITLSDEELHLAEGVPTPQELEEYPPWQREMIAQAGEVLDSADYLKLPGQFDIHEWRIMEQFSYAQAAADTRERLRGAIKGRGAFRCFKDNLYALGIEAQWYRFRDASLAQIAVAWLEANAIPYQRDVAGPEEPVQAR